MPRSPPRDPGDIDGLTVWLDADRGVVLDASGNVSEWRDQSGRGNHATQSTAGNRPTYARDAAGRWVVQTTRAARFLEIAGTADTDPHAALGLTIYAVESSIDGVSYGAVAGKWSAVVADAAWILMTADGPATTSAGYLCETGTNTSRGAIGGDATTGAVRVTALRFDPAAGVRYSLGATAYGPTAIAGVKSTPTTPTFVGRASSSGLYPLDGNVYALIVIRRYIALGGAEDVFIRGYLARTAAAA